MFGKNCNGFRGPQMAGGCCRQPQMENCIMEPTITKCVEKEFYHEVPHVCPIHTHVINKHIYNHSYTHTIYLFRRKSSLQHR